MGEAFGASPDFAIRVEKRVPAGAGLAGGSADASAVIAAIAHAWDIRRSDPRIEGVAASLGADVPFSLRGGCGVYTGLGATHQRTLRVPACHFAIVCGPDPVPTGVAYKAFDDAGRVSAPGPRHVTDAISVGDLTDLGAALFNNMTEASTGLVPLIAAQLDFMRATPGCLGAAMCGSGRRMREGQVEQQIRRHASTVQSRVGPRQCHRGDGGRKGATTNQASQHQPDAACAP